MSTHHSADMTPSDSSEQLSVGEVAQQALAARIFSAMRRPMSSPKYAALLVVLALVFGLGSWGIIHGVSTLRNNAKTSDETVKVETVEVGKNGKFGAADAHGIRHATVTIKKDIVVSDVSIPVSSVPLDGNWVLHVYASSSRGNVKSLDRDDRCDLIVKMGDFLSTGSHSGSSKIELSSWSASIFADDVLADVWIPLVRYPSKNSFGNYMFGGHYSAGIYECGTAVNLDLMKIEDASPVDWDGTEPFQGEGSAFIKTTGTTPGDYIFTVDAPGAFKTDVISAQNPPSYMFWEMEFDSVGESQRDSFVHRGVTSETGAGYIFVYPDRIRDYGIRWTLRQQIDTSASSAE
ncbi:MAG: hypothetical protein IKS49_00245 [Actinomycetaceae bacterium]|nr:hypothetical protein [Actinomycetaceae bacterium]